PCENSRTAMTAMVLGIVGAMTDGKERRRYKLEHPEQIVVSSAPVSHNALARPQLGTDLNRPYRALPGWDSEKTLPHLDPVTHLQQRFDAGARGRAAGRHPGIPHFVHVVHGADVGEPDVGA